MGLINGLDKFLEYFSNYKNQYVIIGGTACSLLMKLTEQDFRITQDIDMVIIAENMSSDFATAFKKFVKDGNYQITNKESEPHYYRFYQKQDSQFPSLIELFSINQEIDFQDNNRYTGFFDSEESKIAGMSAIVLDNDYYSIVTEFRKDINGLTVLDTPGLILLKAKAFIDLSEKKSNNDRIDSKDISKHQKDIFRLVIILEENKKTIAATIKNDLGKFLETNTINEQSLKSMGINLPKKVLVDKLKMVFGL